MEKLESAQHFKKPYRLYEKKFLETCIFRAFFRIKSKFLADECRIIGS